MRWETDFGAAAAGHVNLYDRTVEGLTLLDVPGRARSSTTPRPARARTTRSTSSTASSSRSGPAARCLERDDIQKILIIGSGPIVIGQAAEFDYSGTQACKVLLRGGLRGRARQLEPGDDHDRPGVRRPRPTSSRCCPARCAQIIERERPDALLPTLGGQTALNLAKDAARERHARALRRRADRRQLRRDRTAPRTATSSATTMQEAGLAMPRLGDRAHGRGGAQRHRRDRPAGDRPPGLHARRPRRRRRPHDELEFEKVGAPRPRRLADLADPDRPVGRSAGASSSSRSCATATTTS